MLGFYILPWLVMGEEEIESKPWLNRSFLLKTTLWAPVVLTSLYIILTLVILVSSIDAVQFNAHELYGAPFVMAMALALFAYTSRKQSPKQIVSVVLGTALASIVLAILIPSALGGDASEPISEYLSRGTIAGWCFHRFLLRLFLLELKSIHGLNHRFWKDCPCCPSRSLRIAVVAGWTRVHHCVGRSW